MADTKTVRVALGPRSYDIKVGEGLLPKLGAEMAGRGLSGLAGIITNETVSPLYAQAAIDSLGAAGFQPKLFVMPDGEKFKSLEWVSVIYGWLLDLRFERKSPLVALGGGVIGDITGFAAATYLRGVPFVQVPTTLLSQVDSSVGGKTGVNHPLGKNMIGAFYQPRLVLADIATLGTLPDEEFLSGMAEIVKYGVIYDAELFGYIDTNKGAITAREPWALMHIIRRSCEIKAAVVAEDERESGLRAILNFGHTVGHAVESLTEYTEYRHGEAVAIGMVAAAKLAHRSGLCGADTPVRIEALLRAIGLPVSMPGLDPKAVLEAISHDKKAEDGKVKMVLPRKIGKVAVTADWDEGKLIEALQP